MPSKKKKRAADPRMYATTSVIKPKASKDGPPELQNEESQSEEVHGGWKTSSSCVGAHTHRERGGTR